jgi:hypothetical protein
LLPVAVVVVALKCLRFLVPALRPLLLAIGALVVLKMVCGVGSTPLVIVEALVLVLLIPVVFAGLIPVIVVGVILALIVSAPFIQAIRHGGGLDL